MIWEMTWMPIDQYGSDPNLETGTGGNNIAMRLVMDGMALLRCNPGMVDGRDAIIQADSVNFGGIHTCLIWQAFAKRGLGFSADQGGRNSRTDGSEAFDIPPFCIALPVEWVTLTATPHTRDITVDWEVAMEEQNEGFEVQRKAAHEDAFQKIAYLESKGETHSSTAYTYPDLDVRPGIVYEYRILQVDYNGVSSYSNTVAAMISPDEQLQVALAPNPAGDWVEVRLDGDLAAGAVISVLDLRGKELLRRDINETEARSGARLELAGLPAGQYLVQVLAGGARKVEKLVVQ